MMKAQKTLIPGEPGTKGETKKYGDKLICVRYRIDPLTLKKYKTVELIEEEMICNKQTVKRIPMNKILDIKIYANETYFRKLVKAAGGKWDVENQTWKLAYSEIKALGLEKRIVFCNKMT